MGRATTVGQLAAEIVVIVVGVLLALGAQSWWEARGERVDRTRTLQLLLDDVSRLETVLRNSARADSVRTAIADLLAGRLATEEAILTDQLTKAFWTFGFNIGARDGEDLLPAYADLKSSGRLALLPDTVRVRMPAIELQLTVLSRFLEDLVLHQQTRVDPLLIDAFELDPVFTGSDLSAIRFIDPRSGLEVLQDRRTRNVLALKSRMLLNQLRLFAEAADSLAAVRTLIVGLE